MNVVWNFDVSLVKLTVAVARYLYQEGIQDPFLIVLILVSELPQLVSFLLGPLLKQLVVPQLFHFGLDDVNFGQVLVRLTCGYDHSREDINTVFMKE